MKVLDLQCAHLHSFEGWFGSEAEFQSQLAAGLVSCPLCGSTQVQKKLSAPRLNLSGAKAPAVQSRQPPAPATVPSAHGGQLAPVDIHAPVDAGGSSAAMSDGIAGNPELQALFVRAVREILRQTEDVGNQFADQARRGLCDNLGLVGRVRQDLTVHVGADGAWGDVVHRDAERAKFEGQFARHHQEAGFRHTVGRAEAGRIRFVN